MHRIEMHLDPKVCLSLSDKISLERETTSERSGIRQRTEAERDRGPKTIRTGRGQVTTRVPVERGSSEVIRRVFRGEPRTNVNGDVTSSRRSQASPLGVEASGRMARERFPGTVTRAKARQSGGSSRVRSSWLGFRRDHQRERSSVLSTRGDFRARPQLNARPTHGRSPCPAGYISLPPCAKDQITTNK